MEEIWKPYPEWESFYEVSTHGRVWSVPGWKKHWRGGRMRKGGIYLVQSPRPNGRLQVCLMAPERPKQSYCVATMVATTFLGPRPDGMHCCHNDGDLLNNRLDNLRWDTVSSNIYDEVKHGTHRNSRKVWCRNDHPLTAPNLHSRPSPSGGTMHQCRSCAGARAWLRNVKGIRDFKLPENAALLKTRADEKCDQLMPGWREWQPVEGAVLR